MAPAVTRSPIIAFVTILALAQVARSYPVGPAVSLDKMTAMADLIVKAKVVSNDKVADDWFKPFPGIACVDTRLQIISTIQGDSGRKDINFRHYALDPAAGSFFNFMPQHYELQPGRSYIIFASKTDHPGVFHPLWLNHTTKEDQGILLAASDAPSAGISVKNLFWAELIAFTKTPDPQEPIYNLTPPRRHLQNTPAR